MKNIRILLTDDRAVVREGLKSLINAQPDMEVIDAADGVEAVEKCEELDPDLVVVDMSMPGLNGVQVTTRLREACHNRKVLILTVHEEEGYLRQLLMAGGSGYVLKRGATTELVQAIRAVASGGTYLDPAVTTQVVNTIVRPTISPAEMAGVVLSERETEVLRFVAQGYSNKEVAAKLRLSVKTVETYKARSMEKLGMHSRVDIVRHANQRGWLKDL
ncbi:response regulator [Zavarzinella formosa]|uniref:response regulator n=1 Tax=Zavarzinella formosa TaxID=360055 RepID=UPI0002F93844|nr:response regulator transcription factor [Zavarzinella formosa]